MLFDDGGDPQYFKCVASGMHGSVKIIHVTKIRDAPLMLNLSTIPCPDEYRVIGVRMPVLGDATIDANGELITCTSGTYCPNETRVIVEKIELEVLELTMTDLEEKYGCKVKVKAEDSK